MVGSPISSFGGDAAVSEERGVRSWVEGRPRFFPRGGEEIFMISPVRAERAPRRAGFVGELVVVM